MWCKLHPEQKHKIGNGIIERCSRPSWLCVKFNKCLKISDIFNIHNCQIVVDDCVVCVCEVVSSPYYKELLVTVVISQYHVTC